MKKNNKKNLTKYIILLLIITILVIVSLTILNRKENTQEDTWFIESERMIQWDVAERDGNEGDTIIKNGFNSK